MGLGLGPEGGDPPPAGGLPFTRKKHTTHFAANTLYSKNTKRGSGCAREGCTWGSPAPQDSRPRAAPRAHPWPLTSDDTAFCPTGGEVGCTLEQLFTEHNEQRGGFLNALSPLPPETTPGQQRVHLAKY